MGFETPAEIGEAPIGGKLPDVIWYYNGGHREAIEIELTAKWGWEFDTTIARIVNDVRAGTYKGYMIVTRSSHIQKRYGKAFSAGQPVRHWVKNEERKYTRKPSGDSVIEEYVADAITVLLKVDL
ncbi:hypothetical protein [Solimonas sp. SE-A11]|uniref:hypothetical protein n=1 Tax=Solimonas sp. SE-A11 TaxID=3054954 RepID=UPI00259CC1A1|nr:hypothetical protein [Solimonas sp. SE-A11]MDM4773048.1 hypothetical protein [Solimonas sp. SE-A11]